MSYEKTSINIIDEELESFKSAASSMRWFITTAVLISVLIILHVWLENFGYQENQLQNVYSHRIANYVDETYECYKDMAKYLRGKEDRLSSSTPENKEPASCGEHIFPPDVKREIDENITSYPSALKAYSNLRYKMKRTDNTLDKEVLQLRKIPLLGVEVPANDFVTVMAVMSLVFTTGVWLNLQAINTVLYSLKERGVDGVMEVCRIHLIFVTSGDSCRGEILPTLVRSLAIWLPFISLLLGTVLGYWQAVVDLLDGNKTAYWGYPKIVITHVTVASILILLHLWVAFEIRQTIKQIEVSIR